MNMKHTCTHLPEKAHSVHLLKIEGFSVTRDTIDNNKDCIKSRCSIDGYGWEIRLYPARLSCGTTYLVGLELVFLGEACARSVTATLLGRLVEYKSCGVQPIESRPLSKSFWGPLDCGLLVYIAGGIARDDVQGSGLLTVDCTISVVRPKANAKSPRAVAVISALISNFTKFIRPPLTSRRNMNHTYTHLPEEARSVHLVKIDSFSVTGATIGKNTDCIKSRCSVDGHDWEIRLYPSRFRSGSTFFVVLRLVFLGVGEAPRTRDVTARLGGRLLEYESSGVQPTGLGPLSKPFRGPKDCGISVYIGKGTARDDGGSDHFPAAITQEPPPPPPPSRCSRAFIYTDMMPEHDGQEEEAMDEEAAAVMAQHLLVAADRYGLDRLKLMCEKRLVTLGIGISTVASTLALADQHNCPRLKAKCIEFIAGSPQNLDAVVATEGYRHLEVSSPWVLTELLKAALSKK
ncbi:unnamed protein product [Urochloa decumbens]|uniref:BPM/SPOP BACK domain-containing protein n=1 Tax=Urochloa decumbens TaxID=240449 RepID=A0ABC8WBZ0_9POAL